MPTPPSKRITFCPECGRDLPWGTARCPGCQAPLPVVAPIRPADAVSKSPRRKAPKARTARKAKAERKKVEVPRRPAGDRTLLYVGATVLTLIVAALAGLLLIRGRKPPSKAGAAGDETPVVREDEGLPESSPAPDEPAEPLEVPAEIEEPAPPRLERRASYAHGLTFESDYDKFRDTRSKKFRVRLTEEVEIMFFASWSGSRSTKSPQRVMLKFLRVGEGWKYLSYHSVILLVGAERTRLETEHDGSVLSGTRVLEQISVWLTAAQWAMLAEAPGFEAKLGITEMEVPAKVAEALHDLVTARDG